MSLQERIQRDHYLLIIYHLVLANEGVLRRGDAEGALDNYFERLEIKLPLCLIRATRNDPPPANWRAMWHHHRPAR